MKVTVRRYDPETGVLRDDIFDLPAQGKTVLDLLDQIRAEQDPTLAYYRHSACNRGVCGRCSLLINGRVRLACTTRAGDYGELVLDVPPGRERVRDLVSR